MPLARTDGVVLSRKVSGESDFICSVYTRNNGKQHFIFKGLKKSRKRSISASEPGSIITLVYYSKENSTFNTVSSFEILSPVPGIRKSSLKIFSLYYIVELIEKTSAGGDPGEKIYLLLSSGIEALEKTEFAVHFVLFFTIRYMKMLGILPETGKCIHCGSSDSASYDVDGLTLVFTCSQCSEYSHQEISRPSAEFMKRSPMTKFGSLEVAGVPINEVLLLFCKTAAFIENYFGFRFKTVDLLIQNARVSDKQKSCQA